MRKMRTKPYKTKRGHEKAMKKFIEKAEEAQKLSGDEKLRAILKSYTFAAPEMQQVYARGIADRMNELVDLKKLNPNDLE